MASTRCWHCHEIAQMIPPIIDERDTYPGFTMQHFLLFPDPRFSQTDDLDLNLMIYSCVVCGYPNIAVVPKYIQDPNNDVIRWLPIMPMGKDYPDAPKDVASIASEVHKCYEIGAYRAALVLARTALEGIVTSIEEEPSSESLYIRIEKLAKEGIIKERTAEAATTIRLSGNASVHDTTFEIDHELVEIVMDILDSIIDDLYTQPDLINRALEYIKRNTSSVEDNNDED